MTRLILIALLALPAAPVTAEDLLPPCCDTVERPLPRSQARTWFRDADPARLTVAVARGPAAEMHGFMAASGLTSSVGDGCGPVALRPRTRVIPGA